MKILEEKENLDDVIKDGKWLVDFYAEWCGPCKMLAPNLEEIKGINIIKVNVDLHKDLAIKHGVMSIPTLIIYDNNNEIKRDLGYKSVEELEEFIK